YLNSLSKMKSWRPVIHPNGTTDYEYLWVPKTQISGDPSAEYHVYGFEWDEEGTKFYLDGELVQETDRSPNYPMMTILSLYTDAGMGADENIYPKEAYIDYFRVYKKDEAPRATNVVMDIDDVPEYFYIPDEGAEQVQAAAYVSDQFDQPFADAGVKWRLSETVDVFQPESAAAVTVPGVTVDAATGLVTISSEAQSDQDIFLTAYVNDQVKQTRHIKLSKAPAEPCRIQFGEPQHPDGGIGAIQVEARVVSQYGADLELPVQYQLSSDISGRQAAELEGVSLSQNGALVIADSVPDGTVIIVTAFYEDLYNHFIYKV
ncbi:MAG: glycoside hydrolase family 16 protein, partial [Clostridiales bacterium]|nr:glycoside hydrolase family 16 protein [Clostridiales bacterium]